MAAWKCDERTCASRETGCSVSYVHDGHASMAEQRSAREVRGQVKQRTRMGRFVVCSSLALIVGVDIGLQEDA